MKKLAFAALTAIALGGAAAHAENPTGPYVGGGFGQFNLEIDNPGDFGESVNDILDDDDSSWKLFAGWRVLPWLAVEAAYINLGNLKDRISSSGTDGEYDVKLDGFSPSLIATLPLGGFEIFGKVGYYYYDVDLSTNLGNPGSSFIDSKHSRSDFMYGFGAGFTFFEHLHVRAEYERFDLENYDDSNALWVSAAWRF